MELNMKCILAGAVLAAVSLSSHAAVTVISQHGQGPNYTVAYDNAVSNAHEECDLIGGTINKVTVTYSHYQFGIHWVSIDAWCRS